MKIFKGNYDQIEFQNGVTKEFFDITRFYLDIKKSIVSIKEHQIRLDLNQKPKVFFKI